MVSRLGKTAVSILWPEKINKYHIDDEKKFLRRHDEISKTIRRQIWIISTFSLFCVITLFTPDLELIDPAPKIILPFIGKSVSFQGFLFIAPMIMIALYMFLHIYIKELIALGRDSNSLPYIFNINQLRAKIATQFIFFWLVPLILIIFSWRADPYPIGSGVQIFSLLISIVFVIVRLRYEHRSNSNVSFRNVPYLSIWVILLGLVVLFLLKLTSFVGVERFGFNRPLVLMEARLSNRNLRGYRFKGAFLEKADLSYSELTNVDFSGADLSKVNFKNAKMSHTILRNSILINADFTRAFLREADFRNAAMSNVKFKEAILRYANFSGANLHSADFEDADLTKVILDGANIKFANLRRSRGLTCKELVKAKNWQKARRDGSLQCN